MRPSCPAQVLITYGATTNKCADVTFNPGSGEYSSSPVSVLLSTSTAGAHIFYTIDSSGVGIDPTHSGDNATGSTVRIGSNSGSISVSVNVTTENIVSALAYKSGLLDSNITDASYLKSGGGG